VSPPAAQKRTLSFRNEDEAIAEIDRLRAGGYKQIGNWTIAMMCRHLDGPIEAPATTKATPREASMKESFVDVILKTGRPPGKFEAPPERVPAPSCNDADIEQFKSNLRKLKAHAHSHVAMGPFGPVPTDEFRRLVLMHTAHHLSFLIPSATVTRRIGLQYKSEDDIIADIRNLRRGYEKAGAWSLQQVCYHLERAVEMRMKKGPFEPDTPDQIQRQGALRPIFATGALPHGIVAPPEMAPPDDASDASIDRCITALERLRDYKGQIAPHRFFGQLSDSDARKLNLIHCAHHLSYLVPTS
jgi:hypothetical protein